MEKHLISYAVLCQLKLGKCIVNSCSLCSKVNNLKYIAFLNRHCDEQTNFKNRQSHMKGKLTLSSSYKDHSLKNKLVSSGKEINQNSISNCSLYPEINKKVVSYCGLHPEIHEKLVSNCDLHPETNEKIVSNCGLHPETNEIVESNCGLHLETNEKVLFYCGLHPETNEKEKSNCGLHLETNEKVLSNCCLHTETNEKVVPNCGLHTETNEKVVPNCGLHPEINEKISSYCDFHPETNEKLLTYPASHQETNKTSPKSDSPYQESRTGHVIKIPKKRGYHHLLKNFDKNLKPCFNSLVLKSYFNLKDNHLLSSQLKENYDTSCSVDNHTKKSLDIETITTSNKYKYCNFESENQPENCQESSKIWDSVSKNKQGDSSNCNSKENFMKNLYNKYQSPTPKTVAYLLAKFPEPEKLVSKVDAALMKVDRSYAHRLVVSNHLQGHYWKAYLTQSWPCRVKFQGIHPKRDIAILGAYLLTCEHYKKIGFIFQNKEDRWQPMTCEKIMTMLETLSKYGECFLGCSRGRGFKIVLEQTKEEKLCNKDVPSNVGDDINVMKQSQKCLEDKFIFNCSRKIYNTDTYEGGTDSLIRNKNVDTKHSKENITLLEDYANSVSHKTDKTEMQNTNVTSLNMNGYNCTDINRSKPQWICTIHVGWPFPFTVQAKGVSLPAAQIMGCMLAVNKMKLQGLLTNCNSGVSSVQLEHFLITQTKDYWCRSIKVIKQRTSTETFSADAKIFCDASVKGFGAFLTLKDVEKVSWLSEVWEDHKLKVRTTKISRRQNIHSMLAEMFAIVTAVFTWKHKLRSRSLLCYNDNTIVLSLINALNSNPLPEEACKSSLVYLIYILQTTCLDYNIKLQSRWLDRESNYLADALSRNDIALFQAAVPTASLNRSKAKKLNLRNKL